MIKTGERDSPQGLGVDALARNRPATSRVEYSSGDVHPGSVGGVARANGAAFGVPWPTG
jgi:hypothetical protein